MTFAARIGIAIAGTVVLAMAIVVLAGGPQVRASYLSALRGSIEARVDAVVGSQEARTRRAAEDADRLVRSPRLVASLLAGDAGSLEQVAADELRVALERGGEGAGFLFLSHEGPIAASPGLPDAVRAAMASAAGAAAREDSTQVRYAAVGPTAYELVAAPIIDRAEDERAGTLALFWPAPLPAPLALPDGTVLEAGIAVAGVLHGTALEAADRGRAAAGLQSMPGAMPDAEFESASGPALAVRRPLGSGGTASLVVVAGLGAMRASERALVTRAGLATGVGLAAGLAAAAFLARGLSRPVAALGAAAGRIEHGDYAVRVPDRGRDELSVLARRFNGMAEGLAQREKYRRVLDAVADPDVAAELMAGKLDLGGVEQRVGILFCDVRGFTALTEGMAPHDVIALLNEHMTLLTEVAYAHGGTVDKFVGDLIMVTFGAPKQAPDDAARMARCARAMVEARERANASARQPVRIGVGCAYGAVVAGCMGSTKRLDYTVLGERVNLAARLCSKAPAMHVYVDAATRAAVADGRFEPLPPLEAKGFSRPVEAFDLVAMGAPA